MFVPSLFALPDDVWISILYEWMSNPIMIVGLDIALCNRLLRERYLSWLRRLSPEMLAKIHFQPIFLYWCEKRNIHPVSLSCLISIGSNDLRRSDGTEEIVDELDTNQIAAGNEALEILALTDNQLKLMKNVEKLNIVCNIIPFSCTAIHSSILNSCPKLKNITFMSESSNDYPLFQFHCINHHCYPLLRLKLCCLKFPVSNESFQQFVQACPMLEEVCFEFCIGINASHAQYLLKHCKQLQSMHVNLFPFRTIPCIKDEELDWQPEEINLSMRSLYLSNIDFLSPAFLSILRACPMIEDVTLYWHILINDGDAIPKGNWKAFFHIIATCWIHLKSFCLGSSDASDERNLLVAVAKLCGKTLRSLTLDKVIKEEATIEGGGEGVIRFVCESFEQLEFLCLMNNVLNKNRIVENFQNAKFRNSLRTFKLCERIVPNTNKLDYGDILQCFPRLKIAYFDLCNEKESLSGVDILKQIEVLKICVNSSFPASTMSQCVNLKSLHIEYSPMTQDLICAIFKLPNLQSIEFEEIESDENSQSLFYPENYPSSGLCPLQSFYCSNDEFGFDEEMILTLWQRFPLLQLLKVGLIDMKPKKLKELQKALCYQLTITEIG